MVCKLITSRNIAEYILYRTRYDFIGLKLCCLETYGTPSMTIGILEKCRNGHIGPEKENFQLPTLRKLLAKFS